jgi:hypothetical protein
MPVHRERVDPVRTPDGALLVHRRWLLPDELERPIDPAALTRLWRGLREANVLDPAAEVSLQRQPLPAARGEPSEQDLPNIASAGALLSCGAEALLLNQLVWLDRDEERRDPYAEDEDGVTGFRDYTLYFVGAPGHLLLPQPPRAYRCGSCQKPGPRELVRFGEGALLDLSLPCPSCGAACEPSRDKVELRSGAVFLLEEASCKAALSIELPAAPLADELADAAVSALVQAAFGSVDELADDLVPAAQ